MSATITEKPKPKTRPMFLIYCVLGALAIYIVFLYTQPSSTTGTTHQVIHPATAKAVADTSPNLTPQDLAAHFPRYGSTTKRDPFLALVGGPGNSADSLFGTAGGAGAASGTGTWDLTGINTVNGVLSAVIENGTSGEVVFLQPGDSWKGLRVTDIDQTTVHFVNGLGQETTLTFLPPKVTDPAANTRIGAAGPVSPVPGLNSLPALGGFGAPLTAAPQAQPLPQAPAGGGGFGGGGGRGGRRNRGGGGGGFGGFGGGG